MRERIGLLAIFLTIGLYVSAQSTFDKSIAESVKELTCPEPNEQIPTTVMASLVREKDSLAVIVKVRMAPGWHIYQYVPNMPYIPLEQIIRIPEGIQSVGNWIISPPFPSVNDKGVLLYEKEAWFVQKLVATRQLKIDAFIQAGLYYQTCDLRQCLPPDEKVFDLRVPEVD